MTPLGHHTQVKLCVGETKCVGCLGGPGVGALRSSPRPLCGSGLELPWGTRDGVCRRGGAGSQPVCALPGQPSRTEACLLSQARPPAPPQGARRAVQGQQTSASGTSRPGRSRAVPRFVCPFSFSAAVGSGGVSCMPVPLLDASRPSCPPGVTAPAVVGQLFTRLPPSSCRAGALPSLGSLAGLMGCVG